MHPMLNIAVKAARRAGGIINRAGRNLDVIAVKEKSANDFVSEVDREAEQTIIRTLREAYPAHAILAEESGKSAGTKGGAEYTWIIDPLDGTTNFIHGFPQYAVSIGIMHRDTLSHGVIYDPFKNELFHASRGGGAFMNDQRIRVSKRTRFADALIGTGFPYSNLESLDQYLAMFRAVVSKVAGVRRAGAAALDLAYVAAGRLDGFWELGLSPWDIAAGILIVQEAGGLVSDLNGESDYLNSGQIVGGNPKVFHQLLRTLTSLETPVDE